MKPIKIEGAQLCVPAKAAVPLRIERIGDPSVGLTLTGGVLNGKLACYPTTAQLLALPAGRYAGNFVDGLEDCPACIALEIPGKCI
jgi:hypothetical protein